MTQNVGWALVFNDSAWGVTGRISQPKVNLKHKSEEHISDLFFCNNNNIDGSEALYVNYQIHTLANIT